MADNTIVVYTSDQGFYLGEHGWFDKRWIFEESLRTPLLIRWPGVTRPGSVEGRIVSNLDFAETFLEAAGQPVPAEMQGRSLVPLLRGPAPGRLADEFLLPVLRISPAALRPAPSRVVTDRYKLIHFEAPDLDGWELFDLREDPHELTDVYNDPAHAGVVAELKRELDRLRAELKVPAQPAAIPPRR